MIAEVTAKEDRGLEQIQERETIIASCAKDKWKAIWVDGLDGPHLNLGAPFS
jgi:hypothetical protein